MIKEAERIAVDRRRCIEGFFALAAAIEAIAEDRHAEAAKHHARARNLFRVLAGDEEGAP